MKRVLLIFILLCFSCSEHKKEKRKEVWKEELVNTEMAFSTLTQEKGMNVAFLHFVADDGALPRDNTLIKGKDAIKSFMKNSNSRGLSWTPSFVDVSDSGDLGYTYGTYTYIYQDSLGHNRSSQGIFHTVWKRQADNSWKFVWD